MKLATTLALISLTTATHAATLARADATGSPTTAFCNTAGQPCARVAAAAAAFTSALAASDAAAPAAAPAALTAASNAPGGAAFVAKRAADDLALALASSAGPQGARAYYAGLRLDSRFPPDTPAAAVPADAAVDPTADVHACLAAGAPCARAVRAADAVLAALAPAPAPKDKRAPDPWCHFRGGFCKRDPAPAPWCHFRGGFCRRAPEPWCHFRGGFCRRDGAETGAAAAVEAECYAPDGLCTAKGRDVLAIQTAAEHIRDLFVEQGDDGQGK